MTEIGARHTLSVNVHTDTRRAGRERSFNVGRVLVLNNPTASGSNFPFMLLALAFRFCFIASTAVFSVLKFSYSSTTLATSHAAAVFRATSTESLASSQDGVELNTRGVVVRGEFESKTCKLCIIC